MIITNKPVYIRDATDLCSMGAEYYYDIEKSLYINLKTDGDFIHPDLRMKAGFENGTLRK